MSKITRATQKIFAQNGTDQLAAFGSMKTGTPVYTDNIEALQTTAFQQGWEQGIVADEAPFLEEMNGVLYVFSKQLGYILQEGIAEYDPETTYYKTAIVKGINADGALMLWYSLTDDNTGNDPAEDTAGTNWKTIEFGGGGSSGSGFNMFDLVEKDYILTFEESKGFALLGSYVYKEPVSGSRYGYPDFYAKCLEEYNASTPEEITLGETSITVYVNANGHSYFDIADKTAVDTFYNTYGACWMYGVDTTNERIFLPRNDWFSQNGTTDEVGKFTEAGLPNITGVSGTLSLAQFSGVSGTGALRTVAGSGGMGSATNGITNPAIQIDASLSNPIYGNSDTVQPPAVKKLMYMVVGNTEVTSAITDVTDITTTENDTIPLFTGMYFDFEPNHPSWLKAGNQQNSGGVYTSAYNELVNCLTYNPQNLKVVDVSSMVEGTDYSQYWKVNQENQTFTTPIRADERILVAKKEASVDDPTWWEWYSDGKLIQGGKFTGSATGTVTLSKSYKDEISFNVILTPYAGANNSVRVTSQTTSSFSYGAYTPSGSWSALYWRTEGYTEVPQPSDYTENVELYFKVVNAVQNLQLLDVGKITEALANKLDRGNKEEIITWTAPDYENKITIQTSNYSTSTTGLFTASNPYVAPSDGYMRFGLSGYAFYYVNETQYQIYSNHYQTIVWQEFRVKKGDMLYGDTGLIWYGMYFFPLKEYQTT